MRNIFSNYSQGENRVTSSIISVISKLSLDSITYIFGEIERKNGIEGFKDLIKFEDQASHSIKTTKESQKTIPDAEISANFKYMIETKIKSGVVDIEQISNHLEIKPSKLIVLTPDVKCPIELLKKDENKDRLYWLNFDSLVEIFNNLVDGIAQDYLSSRTIRLFEHERFLLVELVDYIIKENLLSDYSDNVLVIPARTAWDDYDKYKFYICQENRTFRPANYLAFYKDGKIQKEVPQIIGWIDSIPTSKGTELKEEDFKNILKESFKVNKVYAKEKKEEKIKQQIINNSLANINEWIKNRHSNKEEFKEEFHKIIFLASDENIKTLSNQVTNNSKTKNSSKNTAFVQNQRYVSFDKLQNAKTTSELV